MVRLIAPADKLTERNDDRNAVHCRVITALGSHFGGGPRSAAPPSSATDEARIAVRGAIWLEALGGEVEREGVYLGRPIIYRIWQTPQMSPLNPGRRSALAPLDIQTDSRQSLSPNRLILVSVS
jgi:hypothetical protein